MLFSGRWPTAAARSELGLRVGDRGRASFTNGPNAAPDRVIRGKNQVVQAQDLSPIRTVGRTDARRRSKIERAMSALPGKPFPYALDLMYETRPTTSSATRRPIADDE